MNTDGQPWQVEEGTGWIPVPGFGRINPRRDNVDGGREYFTAMLDNGEYATAQGESITDGPETYRYELDQPFWLTDRRQRSIEVVIRLLEGGRYAVRYRDGWPPQTNGGGW